MGPHKIKMYGEQFLAALGHGGQTVVPADDDEAMPF